MNSPFVKWLRRTLTHNFWWKLVSLLLAVSLWFAVVGEPELVTIQAVPVLYRNLSEGLLLLSDAPDNVRAELRGPSGTLTRTTLAEVFASVDLSTVAAPGEQSFTLSSAAFSLPQGVTFLRAVPSQLRLRFDRTLAKDVPLRVRITGTVPAGYRIAGQQITPDTVRISGPQARVNEISNGETDLIDVAGMTQTTEVKVNAFIADAMVQLESPPQVTVRMLIERTGQLP